MISMLDKINAEIISLLCYRVDSACRNLLNIGHIVNEPDYVSNLNSGLRSPLGPFINLPIAEARTLNHNQESIFGCDSMIIIKRHNFLKVGLFEAKWPRYHTNSNYSWDSRTHAGISHFSSQLKRQESWFLSGAVIWEMFFNELASGDYVKPFDKHGSSCILFRDADEHMHLVKKLNTVLWNNNDLKTCLLKSKNIRYIIKQILLCKLGKKIPHSNDFFMLTRNDGAKIEVPLLYIQPYGNISQLTNSSVESFMKSNGLKYYVQFNLDEL